MKNYQKELIWIFAILIASLLIFYFIDGIGNQALDINLHDTYFVVDWYIPFAILALIFMFPIYLTRIITANFENIISNCIFLVINFLVIILMSTITAFQYILAGRTIYPPLSSIPAKIESSEMRFGFYLCLGISLVLIVFELFVVYKTLKKRQA